MCKRSKIVVPSREVTMKNILSGYEICLLVHIVWGYDYLAAYTFVKHIHIACVL